MLRFAISNFLKQSQVSQITNTLIKTGALIPISRFLFNFSTEVT